MGKGSHQGQRDRSINAAAANFSCATATQRRSGGATQRKQPCTTSTPPPTMPVPPPTMPAPPPTTPHVVRRINTHLGGVWDEHALFAKLRPLFCL